MDRAIELLIISRDEDLESGELKAQLEQLPSWDSSIRLEVRPAEHRLRSVDTSVLVAACTAGGAVLGNFIMNLLEVIKTRQRQKITIKFDDTLIEVEGPKAAETIQELLPKIQSRAIIRID